MKSLRKKRILILGAGFGGLTSANILQKNLSQTCEIVIIDKKDYFLMGFVNLWILNGDRTLKDAKISLYNLQNKGITFICGDITSINLKEKNVSIDNNNLLDYDFLIISLGAEYALEEIDGFIKNKGYNLYDAENIPNLRTKLLGFDRGEIAICITRFPYKCPPAPFEASFLINDILIKNETRHNISIGIYTPAEIPLPVAGKKVNSDLCDLLKAHHINFHPLHKLNKVSEKTLEFNNGSENKIIACELIIAVPPHKVPSIVKCSDLINDDYEWINVNKYTLQTKYENVYAIGDVTDIKINNKISIPKAGIFAENQAKVVCEQIISSITNNSSNSKFEGKGFCFMEIGDRKAGYIDTNFYSPDGPITVLESPSNENYIKKIEFEKTRINDWI